MKKAKTISLITTILSIVSSAAGIIFSGITYYLLDEAGEIFDKSKEHLDPDSESVVAGYEALMGLAGSVFGIFASAFIMIILFALLILTIFYLVPAITGVVFLAKIRNAAAERKIKLLKTDGILKIIFLGLPLIFIMVGLSGYYYSLIFLLFSLIMILAVGGSIWQLVICSQEKKNISSCNIRNDKCY